SSLPSTLSVCLFVRLPVVGGSAAGLLLLSAPCRVSASRLAVLFICSPVNYQVAGSCWSASSPSGLSRPPALRRHVVAAACSVLLPHRVACSPFSVVTARYCMLALFC
ncbi:unnamed protein product, partial [Pylaiella littoralis]